jgi:GDP-4-dehydro-6-deoxy-D-mannose reductase
MYHHLDDEMERIEVIQDKVKLFDCDLRDRNSVYRVLSEVKPDIIHHLAAQSFVRASWDNPEFTIFNNIGAELNIFEVCRQLKLDPIIHIAGSSEEYGKTKDEELPIKEDTPLRPMSPYGVSKVAQDMLAQQYFNSYGTKTVITRAFNHEGPRRGKAFVTTSFASQVAEIIKGQREPKIMVGNLEAKRDYTDISDMVYAYRAALASCKYGEPYNICSGKTHKIQEILDHYLSKTDINIEVISDLKRMRPSDLPVLLGDCTKFKKLTGWEPIVSFHEMLDKIFDYQINKLTTNK